MAALAASALGLVLIAVVLFIALEPTPPITFDSAKWKTSPAFPTDSPTAKVRQRMADDLLATVNLNGRSRQNVIELLGPADDTSYFRNYDLVYYLGAERHGFPIDSEWLVIKFSNDAVVEFKLVTD